MPPVCPHVHAAHSTASSPLVCSLDHRQALQVGAVGGNAAAALRHVEHVVLLAPVKLFEGVHSHIAQVQAVAAWGEGRWW